MEKQDEYRLIVKEGPLAEAEFFLEEGETTLGRSSDNDIVVDYSAVSGRHAKIVRIGENYFIEDLGSSNGTFINGKKINGQYLLNSGDLIGLGLTVKLMFFSPDGIAG